MIILAIATIGLTLVAVDFAEARRGGRFGSRGARTFEAPAATRTAPNRANPIDRSMTPRQQTNQPGAQSPGRAGQTQQANRPGMFGGMMGGLLGGLMLGGLVGLLLGGGLGGFAGFLGLIVQVALIALVIWFVMRMLRGRQSGPAFAGGPSGAQTSPYASAPQPFGGGQSAPASRPLDIDAPSADGGDLAEGGADEIGITMEDFDAFEQLLYEIQAAFAREDYRGLRDRATPEIVSFLSEELSENAINGRRNDVRDVKLLQGDLSEAWREGDDEYATVAMRYSSVDVMRDRESGDVIDGDPDTPTEVVEVWTFVRQPGTPWKLSAIQDA
ncbi:MAG: Tim44 domain-containing protein [Pseudomonadota bacterium]